MTIDHRQLLALDAPLSSRSIAIYASAARRLADAADAHRYPDAEGRPLWTDTASHRRAECEYDAAIELIPEWAEARRAARGGDE